MSLREMRVKAWLEDCVGQLERMYDVFSKDVISSSDIGENRHHDIMCDINSILCAMEDTIFKIENVVEEEEEE